LRLSIVSTLYKSSAHVEDFLSACRQAALNFGGMYEIILVNDGSPDNSVEIVKQLAPKTTDIVLIDLSRNFGHHNALLEGLKHAHSEFVYLLDSDMEEEPNWLPDLYDTLIRDNADVVICIQSKRKGRTLERLSGHIFYWMMNKITPLKIQKNAMTARLMSRRYVDAMRAYQEQAIFLPGLFAHAGFQQSTLEFTKGSQSATSYSLRRRAALAVNAISAFSSAPLRYVFYTGVTISVYAFFGAVALIISWFFMAKAPSGWTSIFVSLWLLGGLILTSIGVMGLYLSRIFDEVKSRPTVIIKEVSDYSQGRDS